MARVRVPILTLLMLVFPACGEDKVVVRDRDEGRPVELYIVESPSPPPERPPTQRIVLEGENESDEIQRYVGVLVYYRWTSNGQRQSFETPPPIGWPPALTVTNMQTVILDLGTAITPALVEVRIYRELGSNGIPMGEPILLSCNTLRARSDQCDLGLPLDRDHGANWQLVVPFPTDAGYYYLATSVIWVDTSDNAPKTEGTGHAASWIFVVRRM